MPVKIARSAPRPSFGLPELLVAIHTSRQSCYKAGKSANTRASSGVIRGIPDKCSQDYAGTGPYERCWLPRASEFLVGHRRSSSWELHDQYTGSASFLRLNYRERDRLGFTCCNDAVTKIQGQTRRRDRNAPRPRIQQREVTRRLMIARSLPGSCSIAINPRYSASLMAARVLEQISLG
jgi:hypothetical protein